MELQDATELINKISKMVSDVSRDRYNFGFYSEQTINFEDDSGYPSYLNELCMRIDKKWQFMITKLIMIVKCVTHNQRNNFIGGSVDGFKNMDVIVTSIVFGPIVI